MSTTSKEFHATVRLASDFFYKNGKYRVCLVRFVECDDPVALRFEKSQVTQMKQKGVKFAGELNSDAPYVHYRGMFVMGTDKRGAQQITPAPKTMLEMVMPDRLPLSGCIWILVNEVAGCRLGDAQRTINKAIADGKLIPTRKRGDTIRTVDTQKFRDAFFYKTLMTGSNFHNLQYLGALMTMFGADSARGAMETLKSLHSSDLAELHAVACSEPWLLCFYENCGKRYRGLGELSYNGLTRAISGFHLPAPPPVVMTAIRFYHCSVRTYQLLEKDTEFEMQKMRYFHVNTDRLNSKRKEEKPHTAVLRRHASEDGPLLADAIEYLVKQKALVLFEDGKRGVIYRDWFMARKIVKWLREMACRPGLSELRPGNLVPCIPRSLDDEQREVAIRVLRGEALVMVTGPPGSGKTANIVQVLSRFKRVLIMTAHGMMRKELCKRCAGHNEAAADTKSRDEVAFTIDYVDCKTLYSANGRAWASQFDILVVDEASNNDLRHVFKFMKATRNASHEENGGMGIKQLMLVFDHNQQRPIGIGEPVMALIRNFPTLMTTLVKQHRVHPGSLAINSAAKTMLSGFPEYVRFSTVSQSLFNNERARTQLACTLNTACVINILPSVAAAHGELLDWVLPRMVEVAGGWEKWMRWQFVAFKNEDVDRLSIAIFHWLRRHGKIEQRGLVTVPRSVSKEYAKNGLQLGPGVKIIFKETFKGVWDDATKKYSYPEVRNGEICMVKSISEDGRIVILDDDRVICMDKERHVNPYSVRYGYAVTSYAAQGAGFLAVFTYVHPQYSKATWPAKDSLYTAFTRAARLSIVYGKREDFNAVTLRKPRDRSTVLDRLLSDEETQQVMLNPQRPYRSNPESYLRPIEVLEEAPISTLCTPTTAHVISGEFRWPLDSESKRIQRNERAAEEAWVEARQHRAPGRNMFIDDEAATLPVLSGRSKRAKAVVE